MGSSAILKVLIGMQPFSVVPILGGDLKIQIREIERKIFYIPSQIFPFLANVGFGLVVTLIRASLACNTKEQKVFTSNIERQNVVAYYFPPPVWGMRRQRWWGAFCTPVLSISMCAARHPLILTANLIENHKKECSRNFFLQSQISHNLTEWISEHFYIVK